MLFRSVKEVRTKYRLVWSRFGFVRERQPEVTANTRVSEWKNENWTFNVVLVIFVLHNEELSKHFWASECNKPCAS